MEFLRSFHVGCLLKLTIASDWLITFWVSTVKFATFFKIVFLHLIFIFLFFPFCTYLPLLVKPLYFFSIPFNRHAKCGQLQCSSSKERPVVDYGSFYELKTLTTGEKCR